MAQSIVSYVDSTLDNAKMGSVHRQVLALITFAYFFGVWVGIDVGKSMAKEEGK